MSDLISTISPNDRSGSSTSTISSSIPPVTNNSNIFNGFSLTEANMHLEFWKEFDLDGRRLQLDKTCVEMKEMKTNSIAARKRLNETTKVFRSKSKDEQLAQMGEMLREYQEEIDQLSRRAKFSENAFYVLYKALYEAPDPSEIIEQMIHALSSTSTYQLEIERLKGEINQYDQEFQQLKNQDITIRRLEEQLQEFREKISDKVAEEVRAKMIEIEEEADRKIAEIKDEQRSAERRLAAALESMRQAQLLADKAQSQIFEISSQAESRISALQAENSILAEGSQRSNARIAELERSLEQLQSRQGTSNVGIGMSYAQAVASMQSSLLPLNADGEDNKALNQMLLDDLREECQRKDESLRSERLKYESSLRELTTQISKEKETIVRLRQELVDRPEKEDYLTLKRQIKVLQKSYLNIEGDDGEDLFDDLNPENTQGQYSSDKVQFEVLLTTKLKAVENELVETERQLLDAREQEKVAKSAAEALKIALEASATLVQRLESDLELRTNKTASVKGRSINPLSSSDPSQGLAELLEEGSSSLGNEESSGSHQLVHILRGQRDRYKEKLSLLESSLQMTQQQLESLTLAKGRLEADNLTLYSKIRFLQTYNQGRSQGGRPSKSSYSSNGSSVYNVNQSSSYNDSAGFGSADDQREVEARYQSLYEQGISPFAEFSQFERQRKLNELSVADRIVLNTTMAFVSSHAGRSFLLIYLGAMHLLVFVTLYYTAHQVHTGCDPAIDHLIHQHQQSLAATSAAVASNTASAVVAAMKHMRQ